MEPKSAKGVFDILPFDPDAEGKWRESHLWHYVEKVARECALTFGFQEIRTPLFERTELFERGVGQTTDIVTKEMYTFQDKGGRSLTLRPEGTAPMMRAFIEKNLAHYPSLNKYFYISSMFRYERQQAGRYRQHHQFGVEAIGNDSAYQDVEVIDLLYTFLLRLGLKNVQIKLNSIGNAESRTRYREQLKKYLYPHKLQLSEESQARFETNPLRILDSKNPQDKKILEQAPSLMEFLDRESHNHFVEVRTLLEELGISYYVDPFLVRGLDYYNKTVFEITAAELGAQNSLGGGGRYDGLMKELGGPDLPAFGFGVGIERTIITMLGQKIAFPAPTCPLFYIIPLGIEAMHYSFTLVSQLRKANLQTEMDFSGKKVKQSLRLADAIGARFIIVIGEEELKTKRVVVKEMSSKKEEVIGVEEIERYGKLHNRLHENT